MFSLNREKAQTFNYPLEQAWVKPENLVKIVGGNS